MLRIHGVTLFFYTHHGWTVFSNKWEKMQSLFTDMSQTEKATDLSKHLLWIVYLNVMLNALLLQCNLRITWEELPKISKVFLVNILIFARTNTMVRHTAKEGIFDLLMCPRCANLCDVEESKNPNYCVVRGRGRKHDTGWNFPLFERVIFVNRWCQKTHKPTWSQALALQRDHWQFLLL